MNDNELKRLMEAAEMPLDEESSKKTPRKNDKGEDVPEVCPKCGSKVAIFLRGEPVFLCTNKECEKYFGVVPFNEDAVDLIEDLPTLDEATKKAEKTGEKSLAAKAAKALKIIGAALVGMVIGIIMTTGSLIVMPFSTAYDKIKRKRDIKHPESATTFINMDDATFEKCIKFMEDCCRKLRAAQKKSKYWKDIYSHHAEPMFIEIGKNHRVIKDYDIRKAFAAGEVVSPWIVVTFYDPYTAHEIYPIYNDLDDDEWYDLEQKIFDDMDNICADIDLTVPKELEEFIEIDPNIDADGAWVRFSSTKNIRRRVEEEPKDDKDSK